MAFLNFIFCWPFWLIVSVIKQQIVVLNPLTNDCTYVICFSRRITGYIIARTLRLFVSTINLELIAHYMFSSFGFTFLTAYITKLEGIFSKKKVYRVRLPQNFFLMFVRNLKRRTALPFIQDKKSTIEWGGIQTMY